MSTGRESLFDALPRYYEDDFVTLIHGDCREMLAALPRADLLLTDPPYGMNLETRRASKRVAGKSAVIAGQAKWSKDSPPVIGDDEPFDPSHLLGTAKHHVIFGGNWFSSRLPDASCWLVWDKLRLGTVTPKWNTAQAELAWTDFGCGVRVFSHLWAGYKRDSEIGEHYHPTQKPVALFQWILDRWTGRGDLILDPYCGSGPVLRAAKNLGRRVIGIELDEAYCQIAAARCAQEVLAA